MCDFFNPVTIGTGIDQNKKLPSFWPIGPKMPIWNEELPSKIETVMANLTQIVPSQNINAHMQTKN